MYYLFVLTASSTVLPMFSENIRKDIIDDSYLNIEKLPINPAIYYILSNIAKNVIPTTVFFIGTFSYMLLIGTSSTLLFLFIPTVLIAITLSHLIYFVFTMSNFFSETASVWLFRAIFDFTSGRWVPFIYFPVALKYILYALPFPYAFGALAKNFAQFNTFDYIASLIVAITWILILGLTGNILWTKGSYYFQENG